MNYELLSKLKDAGFVFIKCPREAWHGENIVKLNGVMYFVPTLEELIEACDGKFILLYWAEEHNRWEAQSNSKLDRRFADGDTPAMAVANLWLKLNEK